MVKRYRGFFQTFIAGISMFIATQSTNLMLSGGWKTFSTNLNEFFSDGMTGQGLPSLGLAMIGIGLFGAALFFVIHKINQQSSLPRPGGFIIIALIGTMLSEYDKLIIGVEKVKSILFGWFGL